MLTHSGYLYGYDAFAMNMPNHLIERLVQSFLPFASEISAVLRVSNATDLIEGVPSRFLTLVLDISATLCF